MIKYYCDRCGKECLSLTEIKVPYKKGAFDSFETRPIQACIECKKEFNEIIDKLLDIRFVLFRDFMKGESNGTIW